MKQEERFLYSWQVTEQKILKKYSWQLSEYYKYSNSKGSRRYKKYLKKHNTQLKLVIYDIRKLEMKKIIRCMRKLQIEAYDIRKLEKKIIIRYMRELQIEAENHLQGRAMGKNRITKFTDPASAVLQINLCKKIIMELKYGITEDLNGAD